MTEGNWRTPITRSHLLAASAGSLTFVGGAGDFDVTGRVRHPGDFTAQLSGTMENVAVALGTESCTIGDIVRLKIHYTAPMPDWQVVASAARLFEQDPLPVINTLPENMQPFDGQLIQIQATARRGWRAIQDVRVVTQSVPRSLRSHFRSPTVTGGLRAGEFIAVANRVAEDADGALIHPSDGLEQTQHIMQAHAQTLGALGATLQDAVKMEGYYDATSEWAPMAELRAARFREPGPVATVVRCDPLHPAGALTKIDMMAMRGWSNNRDKYIPREDQWPERLWDWSIPVPYRQGIRLRETIWLGGQVPVKPYGARGVALEGLVVPQAQFTMGYVDDLLRSFGRRLSDLKLLVCYFGSTGSHDESLAVVDSLADCVGGVLPPLTLVPKATVQSALETVEIWGIAQG